MNNAKSTGAARPGESREGTGGGPKQGTLGHALLPLLIDVAVPLGVFYVLHAAVGLSSMVSLLASGVVPAVRVLFAWARERTLNGLAGLVLLTTVAGAALSLWTGSARTMLIREPLATGILGACVTWSAFTAQPIMTAAVRPFKTKGEPHLEAAWERLAATSPAFRKGVARISLVWGVGLLLDCAVRVVGAVVLPVDTMVWLGTVVTVVSIVGLSMIGGIMLGAPGELLDAEAARAETTPGTAA
ncbi:hypothetical protein GKQ77_27120 [Streptomyces sp. BG9H]|uniref:Intracellular septation protein A n=1 Tax=Streptomyces anatolicus TaxID=2675858 RepID=A0ABS6YUY8_9ACTN|nr:VC0807 family protein [Streptomyces anatolicus]MBW5425188.1 hypothetical protein [Streptomyces anatolicus]